MDTDIKTYSLPTNENQIEIIIKNYNGVLSKQLSAAIPDPEPPIINILFG